MRTTMSKGNDQRPPEGQQGRQINIRPPEEIFQQIEQSAREEWRNISQMTLVLVREALEARRSRREAKG